MVVILASDTGETLMFVCLCNGLRESDIQNAVANGADHAANVHKCLGCTAICGRCIPYIEDYLPTDGQKPAK